MNLVWHIVKKDLYRLRWILVLWLVVIAARMGATMIQAGLDEFTFQPFYIGALLIGAGLLPLITFGMVMGLVHDDPVIDQDAFWITRPISNGQLLAAKALGLGLLLFVPVIAALPWWIGHGYGPAQLGRAMALTIEFQLVIAFLAIPLAVLSANGSRFVLNVILAGAGLLGLFLVYQLVTPQVRVPPELGATRFALVVAIWGLASLAIAGLQFFGRRTRRSLVVLGAAAIAGFVVARSWSRAFVPATAAPDLTAPVATAAAFDPTKLAAGGPAFAANLDGTPREWKVVAALPVARGQVSARDGYLVREGEVFMNSMTGVLEIPLGESAPYFSRWPQVGALRPTDQPRACYLLVHRGDGRWVAGRVRPVGSALDVATLRYTHAVVSFGPGKEWRRTPEEDFETWGRGATLFKLIAAGPSAAADAHTSGTKPAAETEQAASL